MESVVVGKDEKWAKRWNDWITVDTQILLPFYTWEPIVRGLCGWGRGTWAGGGTRWRGAGHVGGARADMAVRRGWAEDLAEGEVNDLNLHKTEQTRKEHYN